METEGSKALIRRNSGYKGMEKIGREARRRMEEIKTGNEEFTR
jgi:hypothetical protein